MVVNQIAVTTSVKQIFASQFDAQTVVKESLDKAYTQNGLVVIKIDILIMTRALISEIQLPCQSLAEAESIVRLTYQHRLVQGNASCRCFHREPLLAETQ